MFISRSTIHMEFFIVVVVCMCVSYRVSFHFFCSVYQYPQDPYWKNLSIIAQYVSLLLKIKLLICVGLSWVFLFWSICPLSILVPIEHRLKTVTVQYTSLSGSVSTSVLFFKITLIILSLCISIYILESINLESIHFKNLRYWNYTESHFGRNDTLIIHECGIFI